jgi:hypothetical protein
MNREHPYSIYIELTYLCLRHHSVSRYHSSLCQSRFMRLRSTCSMYEYQVVYASKLELDKIVFSTITQSITRPSRNPGEYHSPKDQQGYASLDCVLGS